MGCVGDHTVMALVDGELPAHRREEVQAHLDDCDACRELVAHTAHALGPAEDGDVAFQRTHPSGDATTPSTQMPERLGPGSMVGRYRITHQLGAGAMGVVYAAEHRDLRRPVALKIVRADPTDDDEGQLRARLLREARAASAIRHPHVVTVHDVLELDDGSPVMVMDRLEGESLRQRLDRGPLSVADARRLADQLLSALEAAQEVGIIHRDLKPDNVFLVQRDDGIDLRILDFGIAKLTAIDGPAAQTTGLTMTGMLVGTPHYMAPEQAFADPDLDARVDLWAVGVIVYEALCGRRPVEGDNIGQLFRRLATMRIPRLTEVAAEVPPSLADWVHGLLTERERRFPDATTARKALARACRSRHHLDDSVRPVALGDSADGVAAPATERSARSARTVIAVAAAAIASVIGLTSLRSAEPAVRLAPALGAVPRLDDGTADAPAPPRPTAARDSTTGDATTGDATTGDATTGDATTGPSAPSSRPAVAEPRRRSAPPLASSTAAKPAPEPAAPSPTDAPASSDGPGKLLTKPPF